MVFGVAAGLADYFDFDPALVRVAWVVAILASGGMALLAYIILAVVMPKKGSDTSASSEVVRENLSDLPEEAAEATSNAGEALGHHGHPMGTPTGGWGTASWPLSS